MTLPFRIVETTPALPLADLLASLQMQQPEAWARWAACGGPALFGPERLPLTSGGQVVGQVVASASLDGTRGAVRLAREAQGRTKAQIIELRAIPSPAGIFPHQPCCRLRKLSMKLPLSSFERFIFSVGLLRPYV
jgi:hypothetical protein